MGLSVARKEGSNPDKTCPASGFLGTPYPPYPYPIVQNTILCLLLRKVFLCPTGHCRCIVNGRVVKSEFIVVDANIDADKCTCCVVASYAIVSHSMCTCIIKGNSKSRDDLSFLFMSSSQGAIPVVA